MVLLRYREACRIGGGWLGGGRGVAADGLVVWLRRPGRKPADQWRVRLLVTIPQDAAFPEVGE